MSDALVATTPMELAGDLAIPLPRTALADHERAEMLALLQSHFEGVTEEQFARDLDEKDWVLRIVREGLLVGFSTLQAYRGEYDGRPINVIYSGDTVMASGSSGSPVLSKAWIALVRAIQSVRLNEPWYWLLLSSGFRTYRFLPLFWREFWPRPGGEPDEWTRELMSSLARDHFGDAYDARAGVVRFANPQRLRPHLSTVPEGRENDPLVRFFIERNPGYAKGDELVCLTELSDANLTAAGQRMVRHSPR